MWVQVSRISARYNDHLCATYRFSFPFKHYKKLLNDFTLRERLWSLLCGRMASARLPYCPCILWSPLTSIVPSSGGDAHHPTTNAMGTWKRLVTISVPFSAICGRRYLRTFLTLTSSSEPTDFFFFPSINSIKHFNILSLSLNSILQRTPRPVEHSLVSCSSHNLTGAAKRVVECLLLHTHTEHARRFISCCSFFASSEPAERTW